MRTLEQKFRTMYQGDLYTVIMKGDELIAAYYEDNNKVGSPSLLHSLEYYLSTGLYSF